MSGIEIERMLRMIDANLAANTKVREAEILSYLNEHGQDVVEELRTRGVASIPTSTGTVTIPMSALETAAA